VITDPSIRPVGTAQDRPFDTLFDTSLRDYSELLRTGDGVTGREKAGESVTQRLGDLTVF